MPISAAQAAPASDPVYSVSSHSKTPLHPLPVFQQFFNRSGSSPPTPEASHQSRQPLTSSGSLSPAPTASHQPRPLALRNTDILSHSGLYYIVRISATKRMPQILKIRCILLWFYSFGALGGKSPGTAAANPHNVLRRRRSAPYIARITPPSPAYMVATPAVSVMMISR